MRGSSYVVLVAVGIVVTAGCGGGATPPSDAGPRTPDAGPTDAGPAVDAGTAEVDAGSDAGPEPIDAAPTGGAAGDACAAVADCQAGLFCAQGVCCNTACDQACEACNQVGTVGACTLRPADAVCRDATGVCDVPELCTGASPACPADGWTSDGTSCGTSTCGSWDVCGGFSGTCGQTGSQSRSCTDAVCGGGTCGTATRTETQTCTRTTDGVSCGTASCGSWGACGGFADVCDQTGTQTRSCTAPVCAGGACGSATTTESQACSRSTDGTPCSGGACTGGSCIADTCATLPACASGTRAFVQYTQDATAVCGTHMACASGGSGCQTGVGAAIGLCVTSSIGGWCPMSTVMNGHVVYTGCL